MLPLATATGRSLAEATSCGAVVLDHHSLLIALGGCAFPSRWRSLRPDEWMPGLMLSLGNDGPLRFNVVCDDVSRMRALARRSFRRLANVSACR